MKLLMLGGTVFLGRHTVQAALARGHEVTLFNRGQRNPELFPKVEKIRGDRDPQKDSSGLNALRGRTWDAVLDFCGYVPRVVAASAGLLAGAAARYVFISSVSVYAELDKTPGLDEDAPVGGLDDDTTEAITGETYGPLKYLCEQAAGQAFLGRALIIRPGLIVGPNDPTDRFTYWPVRVARGGPVLCPGSPAWETQVIDVRDLAEWTVRMVENQATGIYNATGPDYGLSFGTLLATARNVSASNADFIWVDDGWLEKKAVQPWTDLPLWLGPGAVSSVNVQRALASGLGFRSLDVTVRDTLAWHAARPPDYGLRAGLPAERERELLLAWSEEAT